MLSLSNWVASAFAFLNFKKNLYLIKIKILLNNSSIWVAIFGSTYFTKSLKFTQQLGENFEISSWSILSSKLFKIKFLSSNFSSFFCRPRFFSLAKNRGGFCILISLNLVFVISLLIKSKDSLSWSPSFETKLSSRKVAILRREKKYMFDFALKINLRILLNFSMALLRQRSKLHPKLLALGHSHPPRSFSEKASRCWFCTQKRALLRINQNNIRFSSWLKVAAKNILAQNPRWEFQKVYFCSIQIFLDFLPKVL